jgi:two-component system alkaline phosphatase synthesis response regulator PhoP
MEMEKKILVIEDDPATSRLVDYSLRHEGYQVITSSNGLEGLRKARSESPDLIILDVMLPGMDGFEICHRLRAEPDTLKLPILMFSAKAQEIDKDTGIKVGADDYLTKPSAPAEIVRRVKKLLLKNNSSAPVLEKIEVKRRISA